MIISICGLLLVLIALLALTLQRLYSTIPSRELKRLASRGDHLAAILYAPVAYGASMRILLWLIFGLGFSFGVLFFSLGLIEPLAFVLIALSVLGVIILQSMRLTVHSARIAVHAAPVLKWLLRYVHKPLAALGQGLSRVRTHDVHSGLYEKTDMLSLLQQQKEQLDNRISLQALDIMERALQFDDRQAADIYLPISRVKLVRLDDHIGPVLLDELHDSGQSSFLVYEDRPENVVGMFFLRDAVQARQGGRVADLVHPKLQYVHEDFTLRQVLQAFIRTGQLMVVVINSFEEAAGVITLDRLLGELLGEATDDDAFVYEDRAAIAAYKSQKQAAEAPQPADEAELAEVPVAVSDPEEPSPEPTEVVK